MNRGRPCEVPEDCFALRAPTRWRGGIAAIAAAGFVAFGCGGGGTLSPSGGGGAGGQAHPASGGKGGGDVHDAGTGGDSGTPPDADGGTTACTPLGPIPRRLWRLSVEQWGNAVHSLLNLPSAPVLTSRGGELPFASFSDVSLSVDVPMLYEMYNLSSDATSLIDPMVGTTIAPCTGTTPAAQTDCATTFLQAFASQAYRRPVTADELSDLMTVFEDGATDSYNAGIELAVKAMLASPSFLFRTELGPSTLTADANGNYPDTTLTPYEIASQISFTLLGTIPDGPLTAAAADGSLATKAGLTAQINRLVAAPAAQANLTDVVLDWFDVGRLFNKPKDPAFLSAVLATGTDQDQSAIQSDLWTSGRQFVSSILWSGSGKLDDLLTSQTVYVNRRLAGLYPDAIVGSAPTSDTAFVAAAWPASQGRSGLLTQPSYLWAASDPALNSIVIRGKGIHDNVVCQDSVGPPVDLSTPEALHLTACKSPDGTQTLSTCDSEILRSDARLAYQPCQVCHAQLDPYARVLQNFGPIGNYRTVDEAGRSIDPVATFSPTGPPVVVSATSPGIVVPGSPLAPRTVTGAQGLASALISTGVFDDCAAQRMVGGAIGSAIYTRDTCELGPVRAASDGTIQSLLLNVLSADFMRARTGGPR